MLQNACLPLPKCLTLPGYLLHVDYAIEPGPGFILSHKGSVVFLKQKYL